MSRDMDFRSRLEILMELGMILIIMFTGRISATITFFTLVLICHALKLISVLVMPVNQLSFPGVLWSDVGSSFVKFQCNVNYLFVLWWQICVIWFWCKNFDWNLFFVQNGCWYSQRLGDFLIQYGSLISSFQLLNWRGMFPPTWNCQQSIL